MMVTHDKLAEIDDCLLKDGRVFGIVTPRPQTSDLVSSLQTDGIKAFLAEAFQCCQASWALIMSSAALSSQCS